MDSAEAIAWLGCIVDLTSFTSCNWWLNQLEKTLHNRCEERFDRASEAAARCKSIFQRNLLLVLEESDVSLFGGLWLSFGYCWTGSCVIFAH